MTYEEKLAADFKKIATKLTDMAKITAVADMRVPDRHLWVQFKEQLESFLHTAYKKGYGDRQADR